MTDLTAVIRAAAELPVSELPELIGTLEQAKALAWSRLQMPITTTAATAPDLATADQLAHEHHVPKSCVYELARQGRIPSVKFGRYVRFNRADVARVLAEGGTAKRHRLGIGKKPMKHNGFSAAATTSLPPERNT